MNIYIANLNYSVTDGELRELFENFGEVSSAKVIMDRETGRSRGFGFVEMPDSSAAENAISELNESEHQGKVLKVNEARPKEDKPRSFGGGGNSRGGYGGGGGYNRGGGGGYGGGNDRRGGSKW